MSGQASHHRGEARVESRRSVARGYVEMTLAYESLRQDSSFESEKLPLPRPGSFFTLLPVTFPAPMVRRPFAYSDAEDDGFSFVFEIRGKATRGFAELGIGDAVDLIGPLGTGFPDPPEGSLPVLVAGGIGIGPILYLARRLSDKGFRPVVSLGARTAELVPALDWPEGAEVRISTDDGSAGRRGNALGGIDETIPGNAVFYSCGPRPMMAALHEKAKAAGRPCWVSLEETMACGVGACKGCVVKTVAVPGGDAGESPQRTGYKCACTDGPVFDSREIAW